MTSSAPGSTSSKLVDAARQADARAWSQLVELYGPLVYHWCRESGLSPNAAAEAVPNIFRAVLAVLRNDRHGLPTGSFRDQLRHLTHRHLIDLGQPVAADKLQSDTPDLGVGAGSLSVSAGAVLPEAVLTGLEHVRSEADDQSWTCFWKTVVEGRPAIEVAAELGIAPDTVYHARARLFRELRTRL